jgi:hypothetical protein
VFDQADMLSWSPYTGGDGYGRGSHLEYGVLGHDGMGCGNSCFSQENIGLADGYGDGREGDGYGDGDGCGMGDENGDGESRILME